MERCLQYFLGQLIQLASLNERGNATVSFVIAVPLMLLLSFSGLQLVFLLIVQSQINQIADLTARALEFTPQNEIRSIAAELLNNQLISVETYTLDVLHQDKTEIPKTTVKLEVPVKNWLGFKFTLKSIAYAP